MPSVNASVPNFNLRNENSKKEPWFKAKQFLDVASIAYWRIINETEFCCRSRNYWMKPNCPTPIRSRLKNSTETLDWYVKNTDKYYWDEKPWLKKVMEKTQQRNLYGRISKSPQLSSGRMFEPGDFVKDDGMTIEHNWRVVPVGEKQKGFELEGDFKPAQEHVAPFPEELIRPWIESCCPENGTVLDPFMGSFTTMKVARDLKRNCIGFELNEKYARYGMSRCNWKNGLDGHEYIEIKEVEKNV